MCGFYYAASTDLSNAIFSGAFNYDLDSIINRGESGYIADEDTVLIKLRQHIDSEDGWIIARALMSEGANRGITRPYDEIIKNQANSSIHQVNSNFPFVGETKLTARIHVFKSMGKSRVLVLNIINCTAPFPFGELMVDRDNSNLKANPETEVDPIG